MDYRSNSSPAVLLTSVMILLSLNAGAQDNFIITIKSDTAFLEPDTSKFRFKGSGNLILNNFDNEPFELHIRAGDSIIDRLIYDSTNVSQKYSKKLKLIFNKGYEKLDLDFKDDDPKLFLKKGNQIIQQIVILSPSSQKESDDDISSVRYIPENLGGNQGKWPDFSSKYGNTKYRIAIDLDQSFNGISTWKYTKKKGYKFKHRLRPMQGSFIGISIKGLQPKYDSISTAHSFSNLHKENQKEFTSIASTFAKAPSPDSVDSKTEGKDFVEAISGEEESCQKRVLLLRKELLEYEAYLSRNTIDPSIWQNDLKYIYTNLSLYLGMEDFSSTGMRKLLQERCDNTLVVEDIILSYARINNYSIYTSPPVQIEDADVLNYSFKYYKQGKKMDERDYELWIRGGLKIDFSVGFAYSSLRNEKFMIINSGTRPDTAFYQDGYFDTTDSILSITDVNRKQIVSNGSDLNIGPVVLAHFYPRTGYLMNFSGTFGFMMSLDAEYSFLAGASLILGKKQRGIISSGWTWGKVDKLSPKYIKGEIYDETYLDGISDSQLTNREWLDGWFISLTYNL